MVRILTGRSHRQCVSSPSITTETTDDHGMHIVGTAKDQSGRDYYIVKNSWGPTNDYKGYLYVTKAYVQYKTTAFLLNKHAIPQDLKTKMSIN